MPLEPGTRLGVFEVLSTLGAGGMGEVYLARDTELQRDVAIKALPDSVAQDPDRVRRFEREARLLASINHPNIGSIFGLERKGDRLFLVLELVGGDTLDERLAAGSMSLREVLEIFKQIAQALEAAHARGIIHRDLKPANVKITPEGLVKVLDFGLAKPFLEPKAVQGSKTKTAPSHVTGDGQVLGTPAYMSPEQARGETLDKRTDIWSFGCCLFEALSGRHPFPGKTISEMLASVLTAEPAFAALPRAVPRRLRELLRRCLRKDVKRRLHDIGDARLEIEEALEGEELDVVQDELATGLSPWVAAAVALVTLLAGWMIGRQTGVPTSSPSLVRRFAIELPATEPIALGSGPALAISPDGARMAYVSRLGATTELRLRAMDQLAPTELPGTEGASAPFFSPSGEEIGFFSNGKLKSLSLGQLRVRALADGPSPRGASWGGRDEIVFSPGTVAGLQSISVDSASPSAVTVLSSKTDEKSHRWPVVLPDGRSALFTSWSGSRFDIEWVSLDSQERTVLVQDGSYPRYVEPGYVVFVREGTLMATRYDPSRPDRIGEASTVLDNLHVDPLTGAAFYDIAGDGTLVYVPSAEGVSGEVSGRLLRVGRNGSSRVALASPRGYQVPRTSPSGSRLAFTLTEGDDTDVYLSDLDRGTVSRFTFDGNNGVSIWAPDGQRIVFSSDRDGALNLYSKGVGGTGAIERLSVSDNAQFPSSWSPDGERLVYTELAPETSLDIWILELGTGRSEPWLQTSFNESAGAFSPDGNWLAYVSDESGEDEVYLRGFPSHDGMTAVSSGGGREPVWSADGSELYYRAQEWVMAVAVSTSPTLTLGTPRRLFEAPFDEAGAPYANYDITRDGDGFIMIRSDEEVSASTLVVVLNWVDELRRVVPTAD